MKQRDRVALVYRNNRCTQVYTVKASRAMYRVGYAVWPYRVVSCTSDRASAASCDRYPRYPRYTADQSGIKRRLTYFLISENCTNRQKPQSRTPCRQHKGQRIIMARVAIEHNRNGRHTITTFRSLIIK